MRILNKFSIGHQSGDSRISSSTSLQATVGTLSMGLALSALVLFIWSGFQAFATPNAVVGLMTLAIVAVALYNLAIIRIGDLQFVPTVHLGAGLAFGLIAIIAVPAGWIAATCVAALAITSWLLVSEKSSLNIKLAMGLAVTLGLGAGGTNWVLGVWNGQLPLELIAVGASAILLGISQVLAIAVSLRTEFSTESDIKPSSRRFIDELGKCAVSFSAEGDVNYVSERAKTLFGIQGFEISGSGLMERVHLLDRPMLMKALSDVRHTQQAHSIEVRVRKDQDGPKSRATHFTWMEFSITAINDAHSKDANIEVLAMVKDITARKERESQTAEMHKQAEEENASKSRFLATMGHELRTPLNAIVGFAEMMTNNIGGTLDPVHSEYAHHIEQSGRHLLDVVNMLLDVSKIDAGKFELHLAEFEPASLVDPSVHMLAQMADKKSVTLSSSLPDNLPTLIADEAACRQIVINLLSNAVKFSDEGGQVKVSMRRQNSKLAISVSDDGIGMTPAIAKRIGEPFFQGNEGLSRKYEGTGLGLSIVKGLIDLHDGTMRVSSILGKGTTITILLPLAGPVAKPEVVAPKVTQIRPLADEEENKNWPEKQRTA